MRKECEGKCRNENGIYRKVAGSGRSVLKGKINDWKWKRGGLYRGVAGTVFIFQLSIGNTLHLYRYKLKCTAGLEIADLSNWPAAGWVEAQVCPARDRQQRIRIAALICIFTLMKHRSDRYAYSHILNIDFYSSFVIHIYTPGA